MLGEIGINHAGTFAAFVWRPGEMTELPTPAGTTAAFGTRDQSVGSNRRAGLRCGFQCACGAMEPRGTYVATGNCGRHSPRHASAVLVAERGDQPIAYASGRDDRECLGHQRSEANRRRDGNVAVLWQNGTAIDLNSRIAPSDPLQPYVYLRKASRINNLGQIVASGSDSRSSDPDQWYVLTPVN